LATGNVLQAAAEAGTRVLNKTLTDRYLRAANRRLRPKGLSVRICTTAAMQHLVMRTPSGAGPSRVHRVGRTVGSLLLSAPIPYTSRIVRAIADKPPRVQASISEVGDGHRMPLATQRRLAALEGYALPLDFDVPPPAKTRGILEKMGSWSVAYEARQTRNRENKAEKRRRKLAHVEEQLRRLGVTPGTSPALGSPSEYPGPSRHEGHPGHGTPRGYEVQQACDGSHPQPMGYGEIIAMSRRERKELNSAALCARKRQRGPGFLDRIIGPDESKLERKVADADLREYWASDKVLWIVIMNAEMGECFSETSFVYSLFADKEIEGTEQADSTNNEEHIDARMWREQMMKERDALNEEDDSDSDNEGVYGHLGGDYKHK
jgi:hypothetical protein